MRFSRLLDIEVSHFLGRWINACMQINAAILMKIKTADFLLLFQVVRFDWIPFLNEKILPGLL